MNLSHQPTDAWIWQPALHTDVEDILDLVDQNYSQEITGIFTPSRNRMAYHLHMAIVNQSFIPGQELISVARDQKTGKLNAWMWLVRGKYMPYANEEMAVGEFIHTELSLSPISKTRLVYQSLEIWIAWCELHQIPVLCSTSIREDQSGFMRLHDRLGFYRRGSFAYRRIGD